MRNTKEEAVKQLKNIIAWYRIGYTHVIPAHVRYAIPSLSVEEQSICEKIDYLG